MAGGSGSPTSPATSPPAPYFQLSYLYALTGIQTLYLLVSVLAPRSLLELPLGLVSLFLTPGYAIGALVLGPKTQLSRVLTFALVVGWSVAVNVVVGVILLYFHLGLPPLLLGGSAFALIGAATAVWSYRSARSPERGLFADLSQRLQLTGYRPAQRAAAYTLFGAIVIVVVALVYLATVVPNAAPGLSFSITGYGGTSANLPPQGTVGSNLAIWVIIQNNATAQSFTLDVRSMIQGTSPGSYQSIPWAIPLMMGNNTSATDSLSFTPSQSTTVPVEFQYSHAGHYLIEFLLKNNDGTVVRSTDWAIVIT
jgi:uncharacterized membrane protein